ncbi:glycosyltransferase [uncultured Shimia sp.]|uniref:glycosyltransferase family 8 protein n=1 Tax=uncultured Shimia sp. TaxID=573152 RepID=UPI00261236B0|nr:glycosyltransferase [uncultured Shimia sp.]
MNTQTSNRRAVIYCTDEKMLPVAVYSARNAALNNKNNDYDILICSLHPLDIPDEVLSLGVRSEVLDLEATISEMGLAHKWLPKTAFLRLWLSERLGDQYDRILYLDSDTNVVTDRISGLFDVDMGPHPIGAVRDIAQWFNPKRMAFDFTARNIRGQKIFNSGVQLIDTQRFLAMDCLEKMLDVHRAPEPTLQNDQSLLNLGLMGNIAELHPYWNWQWTSRQPYISALVSPNIIHYVGIKKPWSKEVFVETNYSFELYRSYNSFVAQYFPDHTDDFPVLEKPKRKWFKSLGHMSVQIFPMLALYRYFRRFESELDVLT